IRPETQQFQNYSVLLLWGATNDLISVTVDLISMERLTAIWPVFIYIPSGPCAKISIELCNICNSLFCSLIANAVIIQCISFWYRLRVLSKPPPGTLALNGIVIMCVLPHLAQMVLVKRNLFGDPAFLQTVQTLYPLQNWTGVPFYGLPNIYEPAQAFSWLYFIVLLPILLGYLAITRQRVSLVVLALRSNKSMSQKTHEMHRVFVKV
ncbi:hypothetical protein PMAYCL1PPCAC_20547, partial [Pristionchus mayeri]